MVGMGMDVGKVPKGERAERLDWIWQYVFLISESVIFFFDLDGNGMVVCSRLDGCYD